jgi:phosphosulfolactate phosphohydrolase-like enzyme
MAIHRVFGVTGVGCSRGYTLVVDQLRFSVSSIIALSKLKPGGHLYVARAISPGLALKQRLLEAGKTCMIYGEDQGAKIPEADYGNSPAALEGLNDGLFDVVFATSSNGVPILEALLNRKEVTSVLSLSLMNFSSTLKYLQNRIQHPSQEEVTIIEAGTGYNRKVCHADCLVAKYFHMALIGQPFDAANLQQEMEVTGALEKFVDPPDGRFPKEDRAYLVQMDTVDFAVEARLDQEKGFVELVKREKV